jgi:hypothetical protein
MKVVGHKTVGSDGDKRPSPHNNVQGPPSYTAIDHRLVAVCYVQEPLKTIPIGIIQEYIALVYATVVDVIVLPF